MAERLAKVPLELLALNKRTVHRAMDIQGIRAGIRATTELQALGGHQRTFREFNAALAESTTGALTKRDESFGDYRTGSGDRTPAG